MRFFTIVLLFAGMQLVAVSELQAKKKADPAENAALSLTEDTLMILADSMLEAFMPDQRLDYNMKFAKKLHQTLQDPESFTYDFPKLSDKIHILRSPDGSFKIFNWLLNPGNDIRRYYAIIQTADDIFPLQNFPPADEATLLHTVLKAKHWYGAEYYKIIQRTVDTTQYYFIFGLNTDGVYSNKKILDVLSFNAGEPQFGAPLFVLPDDEGRLQTQHRGLWEYSRTAAVSLNYDSTKNMIIFDRLHSSINDPARKNTFVPTGQLDGLKWENNRWTFVKNAIRVLQLKDGEAPIRGVINRTE